MKFSKDQKRAIIDQVHKISSEKKTDMKKAMHEAIAKEEDPFVRFFRKLSKSPKQAAGFCAELMQYFIDIRGKWARPWDATQELRYITVPFRNMADPEHNPANEQCGSLPVFDSPELDAEVGVRRKKFQAVDDDVHSREQALDAYVDDLVFRVELLDVPDAVIKLLDDFKKKKF